MKLRKAFVLFCVSVAMSGCIPWDDNPYPNGYYGPCFGENNPAIVDRHAGTYDGVVCVVTSDTIIDTLSACHITFGDYKDMHIYSNLPVKALAELTTVDEDKDAFYNSKDSFSLKLGYYLIRWQGQTKDPLYSYEIHDWNGSKNLNIKNHVYQFSFSIKQKKIYDPKFSDYKYYELPAKGFSFKNITIQKDGEEIPLAANKELTVLGDWL